MAHALPRRMARVAVVGGGPCGFYASDRLLRQPWISVDMFERLPAPFGLVRYGVAPDHPEVKLCTHKFQEVAEGGRFRLAGNVRVGSDLSVYELRQNYDAVLFATGADSDRELGVPGESLGNVVGARSFVGWYNGHPASVSLPVDLHNSTTAAVFGHGNVALDVARILLSPLDKLAHTDISAGALAELARSNVRRVELVGRRGPLEAAFTIKELREMLALPTCRLVVPDAAHALEMIAAGEAIWTKQRAKRRLIELLRQAIRDSMRPLNGESASREFVLRFLTSPASFEGKGGRVARAHLLRNTIGPDGRLVPGGERPESEPLKCDLVVRSIGYLTTPIDGVPFDDASGRVRASPDGRILSTSSTPVAGVIATTMAEAHTIADVIVEDLQRPPAVQDEREGFAAIERILKERGVRTISYADWRKIDAEEVKRGSEVGKPREKVTSIEEMLAVAAK